jgi:cadmium resistance transport/sequestration family protein
MNELVTAIPTGITAFTVTNLDDLVILTLLFSQVNTTFRCRHIVIGQYLGFAALVVVSLCGFFGGLFLPSQWIGLLGLVPIAIGLQRFFNPDDDAPEEVQTATEVSNSSKLASFLSPQTYSVAAITIANGGDNVGIYAPLFANTTGGNLLVIISIFFLLVGIWCYATYKLTRQKAIAEVLTRYGNNFVPFVLIGLGVFIILESNALTPLALAAICLCLTGLVKINGKASEVMDN